VKPVAVGRFEQQDVRLADGGRIGQDGSAVAAEIAAEQNGFVSDPDASVGRAQQMPGVDEFDLNAGDHRHGTVVANRLQPIERASGVNLRIKRLSRDVLRVAMLVRLPRVLLLDVRGIRQHERAQVARARRTKDAAAKALADQPRKVTTVIEMSMREDDCVDLRRRDRKRRPVAMPQLFETLKEAAVDENPMVAEIEQMF
jgi:hypothetical protein